MRLLTAVSGVRVPQQAPKKHLTKRCFFVSKKRDSNLCAAIFAAPSAQPRRHCLPAVDAIAPSANDTLFRRAPRSLRGFESEGRRQKKPPEFTGVFLCLKSGIRTPDTAFFRSVLRHDGRLFGVCLNTHHIFSKTESRAAQPNFHRRQSRRLKVAARSLSVERLTKL